MPAGLWFTMLLACGRLSSCVGGDELSHAPSVEEPSADRPVIEPIPPAADAGPTWTWAAVVRVEAGRAEPEEVALRTVGGQPLAEPGMPGDDPLDDTVAPPDSAQALAEVEDALRGQPLTLWRAPAGARLRVPAAKEDGEPVELEIPAHASPGWLVFTDAGVHRLEWGDAARVLEIRVALGLVPWRVVLDVGGSAAMGAVGGHAGLDERFADADVRLVEVEPDAVVPLPFSDRVERQVDVAATLAGSGIDRGFILVAQGKEPLAIKEVSPFLVMRRAGGFFGVDITPAARRGGQGRGGVGRGGVGRGGMGRGGMGRGGAGPGDRTADGGATGARRGGGRFMRGKAGPGRRFGPGGGGRGFRGGGDGQPAGSKARGEPAADAASGEAGAGDTPADGGSDG